MTVPRSSVARAMSRVSMRPPWRRFCSAQEAEFESQTVLRPIMSKPVPIQAVSTPPIMRAMDRSVGDPVMLSFREEARDSPS